MDLYKLAHSSRVVLNNEVKLGLDDKVAKLETMLRVRRLATWSK